MTVEKIINSIIDTEGGYTDNKSDLGGPTNFGITEKEARVNGYTGDMKDFPRQKAYDIYLNKYWLGPRFDEVAKLSEVVAGELCDTGVNMGVLTAKLMLQRALNLLNRQGKDFPDLKVDGQIGPGTMSALAKYLAKRGAEGEKVLMRTLMVLRGARYVEITEARPENKTFFYGWMLNRVGV
jgi:lysozyme family protein